MSGDLQVRKRQGKDKKKDEVECDNIAAVATHSDSNSNGLTAAALSSKSCSGKTKSRDESAGSGCLAKLLFVFLISTLLILAGLIYVQLDPNCYLTLPVNESPNIKIEASLGNKITISNNEESREERDINKSSGSRLKQGGELDMDSIEEQIVSEEDLRRASTDGLVREVVVDIPEVSKPNTVPVQEEPIIKETAHVLGDAVGEVKSKSEVVDESGTEETISNLREEKDDSIVKQSKENLRVYEHLISKSATDSDTDNSKDTTTTAGTDSSKPASSDHNQEDEPSSVLSAEGYDAFAESSKASSSEPSKTSPSESISLKKEKKRHSSRRGAVSKAELQVESNRIQRSERLMEAILELSPDHPMVAELRPHLDGASRDLQAGKLKGLGDTTKQLLIILEDLYVRLADLKEHGGSSSGSGAEQATLSSTSAPTTAAAQAHTSPPSDASYTAAQVNTPTTPDTLTITSGGDIELAVAPRGSHLQSNGIPNTESADESLSADSDICDASAASSSDCNSIPENKPLDPVINSEKLPIHRDVDGLHSDASGNSVDSVATSDSSATFAAVSDAQSDAASATQEVVTNSEAAAAATAAGGVKESVPRELGASEGSVSLEDLTEDDLASTVDMDRIVISKLQRAEQLNEQAQQ